MKYKMLGAGVSLLALALISFSGPIAPSVDQEITLLAIPVVTAPVTGTIPVTTSIDTAQYTGTIGWSPAVSGTFAASTAYTAKIALTPKTGFTLTGVAANSFTLAGATAAHAAGSGMIAAVFPPTYGLSYISPRIGTLKYVPAGSFQRDQWSWDISAISQPFRISAFEITRAQYSAIMGSDPVVTGGYALHSSGITDPVMNVSWYHAIAFAIN